MIRCLLTAVVLACGGAWFQCGASEGGPSVFLVVGAPGEPEYGTNFLWQAALWERAAERAGATTVIIGVRSEGDTQDLDLLRERLAREPVEGSSELWLVLIGHGTFDGKEARFNLRGPDLTASDLAAWLKPQRRPLAVINTASSSAPFLNALSGTNRVVVAATRSGAEQNVTRFGLPFAEALQDPAADLDHDGQTSILEAFLSASRGAQEFYKTAGRLATEHALLDDSGDGLGTPAEWFRGVRATRRAKEGAPLDGPRAHQWVLVKSPAEQALSPEIRRRRDLLLSQVEELRARKASLPAGDYYRDLESLLLELARLDPEIR